MIAHIFPSIEHEWVLELAVGNPVDGWEVVAKSYHQTKLDAKRAAYLVGAHPWNY